MKSRIREFYETVGREEFETAIKQMDSSLLLEYLDDTIQYDICNVSNETWTAHMQKDKKPYLSIVAEIKHRLHK